MGNAFLTASITDDLKQAIQQEAEQRGVSTSAVVRWALQEWLDRQRQQRRMHNSINVSDINTSANLPVDVQRALLKLNLTCIAWWMVGNDGLSLLVRDGDKIVALSKAQLLERANHGGQDDP